MGTDDEECDLGEDVNAIKQTEKVVTADISSLNALAGQSNPRSLHVLGEINGHHVNINMLIILILMITNFKWFFD